MNVLSKGADSVIYDRLSEKLNSEQMKQATQEHLEEFATHGLRTLCCAVSEIDQRAYDVSCICCFFNGGKHFFYSRACF